MLAQYKAWKIQQKGDVLVNSKEILEKTLLLYFRREWTSCSLVQSSKLPQLFLNIAH